MKACREAKIDGRKTQELDEHAKLIPNDSVYKWLRMNCDQGLLRVGSRVHPCDEQYVGEFQHTCDM
jgi:hypothetical protein